MTTPAALEVCSACACALAGERAAEAPGDLRQRRAHWRDRQLVRRALACAGDPGLVLDLSCSAGYFWPSLTEKLNRVVMVADRSPQRLAATLQRQPAPLQRRLATLPTAWPAIELGDNAVDCVFGMAVLSRCGDEQARAMLLREFQRVSRDSVILAVRVAGHAHGCWPRWVTPGDACRHLCSVAPRRAEEEFAALGLSVDARYDYLPGYAMWRVYVLRKR